MTEMTDTKQAKLERLVNWLNQNRESLNIGEVILAEPEEGDAVVDIKVSFGIIRVATKKQ